MSKHWRDGERETNSKQGSQKGIAGDGARRQFGVRVDQVVQTRLFNRNVSASLPIVVSHIGADPTYLEDEQEAHTYEGESDY